MGIKMERDKELIRRAMVYRSGSDSCNSMYMGSMSTARLYYILGLKYGDVGFDEALEDATRKQLDKLLEACDNIIEYMKKYPMKRCSHCGQVMSARKGASTCTAP